MNKRQKSILQRHEQSRLFDLFDCYARYSDKKYRAYQKCISTLLDYHGYNFKIISYNTNMFTCGFYYDTEITGQKCFYYMTKTRHEFWEIK